MPPALTILLLLLSLACFIGAALRVPSLEPFRQSFLASGLAVWVVVQILALLLRFQ